MYIIMPYQLFSNQILDTTGAFYNAQFNWLLLFNLSFACCSSSLKNSTLPYISFTVTLIKIKGEIAVP